ncbi:MAG: hypothetical protein U9R60_09470 [Bacteroidota bacterium]|nr:hypothetical protein [Bacteroidota bacterium]
MSKLVNKITIQAFAYLVIGIMGILIANKAVFMHTHKMADGTIAVHSHPYNKANDSNPFKTHHHQKVEFLFYTSLELLFPLLFLIYSFLLLSKSIKRAYSLINKYFPAYVFAPHGRAPPRS